MCGIIGIYKTNGDASFDLSRALKLIGHRGPDDHGIYIDESAGLGLAHSRLSILDVSSLGHQPMTSCSEKVTLVFNGEIYNFKELRVELESEAFVFRSNSDTEVLLNLYLYVRKKPNFAKEMLRKLNGIFAFAIWDEELGSLLLARDGLGVKPLYFSELGSGIVFSSEIKALKPLMDENESGLSSKSEADGKIDGSIFDEVDAPEIDRYLSFLWCPGEGTPLRKVRKLCPGHAILARNGMIEENFKWYESPFSKRKGTNLEIDSFGESSNCCTPHKKRAISGTEHFLRLAVHRQMVSDVPLGAFLSGGLDSSSIVAFAKEIKPDIRCFTIDVVGTGAEGITNDLPYARKVAEHLDVPLDVVKVNSSHMANDLEEMVYQLDEPLADPAALNVLYISRLARKQGIKVLLSGAGGDDIFTGYRRHWALESEKFFSWMPKTMLRAIEKFSYRLNQNRPLFRRMAKFFDGVSLSGDARLVNYFRWIRRNDLADLYSNEFRKAMNDQSAEDPMMAFLRGLPDDLSRLDRLLALEQRFFLAEHNLNYTDKMSMAAGVEVRVPFLDNDLVEFATGIPGKFKQRGREGKWILKKAMEPFLPKQVVYRSKSGFGAPVRLWIKNDLNEMLNDYLSVSSLNSRGLFDAAKVHKLISRNENGEIDASYTLLSLLCIEIWCRHFLDDIS